MRNERPVMISSTMIVPAYTIQIIEQIDGDVTVYTKPDNKDEKSFATDFSFGQVFANWQNAFKG
jgi:hypothetical protein